MNPSAQEIPCGWENLTFTQAIEPVTDEGKRVDRSDYLLEGVLPVIDQGEEFIGGYTNNTSMQYRGPLPVIVFGDHTRRVKLVSVPFVVGAQGVKLLLPKECWDPRFLAYLLPTLPLPNRGYGRHYQYLRQLNFPCPPKPLQLRIVAEIEKQFTRLEAGVAGLRRVPANLKRYRAAVLKAACEGKLVPTEAELAREREKVAAASRRWSSDENQSRDGSATQEGLGYETGAQLLDRILTERRQKWTGTGKYKEPGESDTTDLQPLRQGWTWSRLEQLGFTFGGLTKNPKRAKLPKQLPYLRVANVYANEFRLHEIEQIGVADSELKKLLLHPNDILIVEGNGSKDQIGRLAIWDGSIEPCVHQNHLIKVRPVDARMAKWLLYWLLSPVGRHFVESVASSTSGLYTLSVNKVGDLPIPIPPLAEQQRIVGEVERRLSVVEELEAVVNANLQRATRLRQSILQRAFEGKLVRSEAGNRRFEADELPLAADSPSIYGDPK